MAALAQQPPSSRHGGQRAIFDAELVQQYDGRGPRYTSYPTANRFSEDFDPRCYRAAALGGNQDLIPAPLSLYLHVPFCHSLCYYCGCNKIVTQHAEKGQHYLKRLAREAALQGALFDSERIVNQLHLGGGTPTFLDDAQLQQVMDLLQRHFSLQGEDGREFSIEIDPRTVDPTRIRNLARMGFNRISLGVQDFDSRVQAAVNRIQPFAEVSAIFDAARRYDYRSISVDLIYGLPFQNRQRFANTIQQVIGLRPDRISLYSYAHLPQRFKAQRLLDGEALPDGDEKLRILELAVDGFQRAGYEYIGMDHFALPEDDLVQARDKGDLQRNFQGYSTHAGHDLVGLGVSAISSVGGVFAQNDTHLKTYYEKLEAGQLPISKGLTLDHDDLVRRDLIQELMCYARLDLDELGRRWQIDASAYFEPNLRRLEPLIRDQLVEIEGHQVLLTDKGRLLMRPVAMAFDRYLGEGPTQQFSRVI